MADNLIAAREAATVRRLAQIIRDGTDTEAVQAFDDLIAAEGPELGGEIWNDAIALADACAELENAKGGIS